MSRVFLYSNCRLTNDLLTFPSQGSSERPPATQRFAKNAHNTIKSSWKKVHEVGKIQVKIFRTILCRRKVALAWYQFSNKDRHACGSKNLQLNLDISKYMKFFPTAFDLFEYIDMFRTEDILFSFKLCFRSKKRSFQLKVFQLKSFQLHDFTVAFAEKFWRFLS